MNKSQERTAHRAIVAFALLLTVASLWQGCFMNRWVQKKDAELAECMERTGVYGICEEEAFSRRKK